MKLTTTPEIAKKLDAIVAEARGGKCAEACAQEALEYGLDEAMYVAAKLFMECPPEQGVELRDSINNDLNKNCHGV